MKKWRFLAVLTALLPFITACGDKADSISPVNTLKELEKQWQNPSREYRTAPFFVWNSDTKKSDIDRAMNEFKDKGIGGVFIHPRMGMITDYLSDDWFDLCVYTLELGKKLDIDVWLYDENGFPSGMAGGLVQEALPSSYNQGHSLGMMAMEVLNPDPEGEYTVVVKEVNGEFIDITSDWRSEIGQNGKYYLFPKLYMSPSPRYGGFPYVNLLMPGVTEKFIEITMPGYEKHMGHEFGKWVPGIFTDEPHIRPETGATWFTDVFEIFEERWGYDLRPQLPKLFTEVGEDWRMVRHNYRQMLLETKMDRWARPWKEYLDAHDLKWTGHYWEHAWPNPHVSPDYLMMYTYHKVPAIDVLFNQYDEVSGSAQFGNVRSVREVRSIANQMGYHQTMAEIYAGIGWEVDFYDMKRQGDWINVLGINNIIQHYSPVSIKGIRKTDYPGVFSYQLPWWNYYGYLGEYHARMTVATMAGEQLNDILVIAPTTSAWMYYIRGENKVGYKIGEIARPYQQFITDLERNQAEYDITSEEVMHQFASNGESGLTVGERNYRTVVIPSSMENINRSTFELLKQYVAAGGRLLVFGNGPQYLEGAEAQTELATLFHSEEATRLEELTPEVLDRYFRNDDIRFAGDPASQKRLYHKRTVMADGQMLLLTNTGAEGTVSGQVTVKGADVLSLDPMTGEIYAYPNTFAAGNVTFDYHLNSADNLVLYISDRKLSGYKAAPVYDNLSEVPAQGAIRVAREGDNVLVIDYCDLTLDGKFIGTLNTYEADNRAFEANGFPQGNPWFFSSQYRDQFVGVPMREESRVDVAYQFTVADGIPYDSFKAVVERAESWNIEINGHPVTSAEGEWWIDVDFGVVPIGQYVRPGVNELILSVSPMTVHSEICPVYILGDFGVYPATKGWMIGKETAPSTGSWKEQQMPFYSHGVDYTRTFDVAGTASSYVVELDDWRGTVAGIYVNGQEAGIIGWPPYLLDVSEYIKDGENEITVKVIGSYKNLFGSFYTKARGQVSPALMKRAPQEVPVPSEFDLFDYGIFGDFRLLRQ